MFKKKIRMAIVILMIITLSIYILYNNTYAYGPASEKIFDGIVNSDFSNFINLLIILLPKSSTPIIEHVIPKTFHYFNSFLFIAFPI